MGELDVLGRREKRDVGAEESVLVPPPVRRTNQENVRYAMQQTQKPFQRIAVITLGCALMLVGVIGLFLPVVPGGFFIVAGVLTLSPRCPWLRRALEKSRARFPLLEHTFTRLSAWWETCRRHFTNPSDSGSKLEV
jgi:hypothetical protein